MAENLDKYRYLRSKHSIARWMKRTACSAVEKNNNTVSMQKLLKQRWREFWHMLDTQLLTKYPSLATKLGYIEGITGIRKDHVLLGLISLVLLYIGTAYFASISSDFISLAYPMYFSIKAKESKDSDYQETWLTYWTVYSALVLTEYFLGRILSVIPAYFLLRTAFIIWCMAPYAENGSHFVYNKIIQPFYLHHHGQMESAFSRATDEMKNLRKNVVSEMDESYDQKED